MKKEKKHSLIILLGVIMIFSIIVIPYTAKAKDQSEYKMQVVSVYIEEGDTLWSIAKQHYSKEYKSMKSFIKEIKRTNGLYSDTIHEGNYIVVPYYVKVNH